MARHYLAQAEARLKLVQLAKSEGHWAVTVREAQECVELLLKAALRHVGLEVTRTHDVAEPLRRIRDRFPEWFAAEVDHLASISSELAGDRGISFYGDERQGIPAEQLFGQPDAERAAEQLGFVHGLCRRLISPES
ncbi:MAG: HEPN domain-containing protein [Myxococcota bacterium]